MKDPSEDPIPVLTAILLFLTFSLVFIDGVPLIQNGQGVYWLGSILGAGALTAFVMFLIFKKPKK